jgi:pilus assembly protein CpaD
MKSRLVTTLALAVLATGCATKRATELDNTPTIADNHKIAVTKASEQIEVPVAAGDTALTPESLEKVETFARLYVRQGHGALVLSAPTNAPNGDAAALLAKDVRMRLAGSGVPFAAIASSTYDGADKPDAPIILAFTRYSADGPDCEPLWSQDIAHSTDNQPWSSFGCAQQANLAAMISDPADLLGPRPEDPRDAGRRARVLEAYRQGQQTHAERSNDERVQVSKAVQ